MIDKLWKKVARKIINVGMVPFVISETLIEFLQTVIPGEEHAEFIAKNFKKKSLNLEQIKKRSDLSEDKILKLLDDLMEAGVIAGIKSKSQGIRVYYLLPLFPGILEFSLMRGDKGPKQKKIAELFEVIQKELNSSVAGNIENILPQFKNFNPISRTVPVGEYVEVNEDIKMGRERVILSEDVYELVDHYDPIALANVCYCKHERALTGHTCEATPNDHQVCIQFGKAAEFVIERGFAKKVTKEEGKAMLKRAEEYGLVHKVFHSQLDLTKDLDGICNCCKCCCGLFRMHYDGAMPIYTLSTYMPRVSIDKCIGCGTCEEKCPMEAIILNADDKAEVLDERCIGCGVCARFCSEEAIIIERTGPREVLVPPPIAGK